MIILVAATGFALGAFGTATTPADAAKERRAAYEKAATEAETAAYRRNYKRGYRKGVKRGKAKAAALTPPVSDVEADATDQTADATAQATEATDQVGEATDAPQDASGDSEEGPGSYTNELPPESLGYLLPEEERSLSCVGVDADTGECVGD
jgi:hypothetical protein